MDPLRDYDVFLSLITQFLGLSIYLTVSSSSLFHIAYIYTYICVFERPSLSSREINKNKKNTTNLLNETDGNGNEIKNFFL